MIQSFRNMKYKYKLLVVFLIMVMIPLLTMGVYSYEVASTHIQKQALIHGQNASNRLVNRFDKILEDTVMVSHYLIGDPELEALLQKDYSKMQYPLYYQIQDRKKYKSYMNHLMNLHTEIDYFFLFPFNQSNPIGISNRNEGFYVKNSDYRNTGWYRKTIEAKGYWVYHSLYKEQQIAHQPKVVSISRLIKDSHTQQPLAVAKIMVDQNSLEEILETEEKESNMAFLLTDKNGQILAKSPNFPNHLSLDLLSGDQALVKSGGEKYVKAKSDTGINGWVVYSVSNQTALLKELSAIKVGLAAISGLTLIVSVALAYGMGLGLAKPLERLKKGMKQVQAGNWKQLNPESRYDEIGDLTRYYNEMVHRLEEYVNLLIKQEREKKDLQYRSLQSQINPHFLYNTLNTIKMTVMMEKPELTSELIDALIHILRSISKREEAFISIKEEIEFLENYITIMKIRYYGSFKVIWEISREIQDHPNPVMLLQPVVENAILHGLEKEQGEGCIWIRGLKKENGIRMEVEDNGVGLDCTNNIVTKNKLNPVGLENVRKRLRLIYGMKARMEIESDPDQGTKVIFEIPSIKTEGVQ